ncbi:MAG: hypothetical protein M8357_01015 [Desulfobulbaceae bacterium]|nr:hypothetical protein [Desulfobulbaceae bacterium]
MATWKKKDREGTVHFQFLCQSCNSRKQPLLEQDEYRMSPFFHDPQVKEIVNDILAEPPK